MRRPNWLWLPVLLTGAMLVLSLSSFTPARAGSPREKHEAIGELAGEWWIWVAQFPWGMDPINDPDGQYQLLNQSGDVYFLAGTFGAQAERWVTVPKGKSLFFPIFNSLWWTPGDEDFARQVALLMSEDPLEVAVWTDEEAIAYAAAVQVLDVDGKANGTVQTLTCTVDGKEVKDIERGASGPFVLEDTTLFGIPGPVTGAADGYWVLLKHLTPGKEHVIRFTATRTGHPLKNLEYGAGSGFFPFADFQLDVTYHVTVPQH